jgi:hypothetical protein
MKRRDFVKDVALAGAGLLCVPAWKEINAGENRQFSPDAAQAAVPSLDDLAGDWISGEAFEQTPAICNCRGGIQAGRNVLSINSFVSFPLAQGGELAQLSVDGAEITAQEYRWYAYQMLRRAKSHDLQIMTTVRMPFEASGVLFRVDVTNLSKQVRTANLAVALGSAIREYSGTWHWDPPRPDKSSWQEFDHTVVASEHGEVLLTQDTRSQSAVAFGFLQQPDKLAGQSDAAQWNLALQPGESRQINFVMAAGTSSAQTLSQISEWSTHFDQTFDRAKEEWRKRFLDAFKPNNGHFSGNLPTLLTRDAKLRRLYYMSVVSLLELERTNLHPDFPRVFVTASPRWGTTLAYFWDTSIYPTVLSLLDPVAAKQMLKLFLGTDIHTCYAIDIPSLKGVGPWYSANDYMIFQLATTYLCVTRDWQFLEEDVGGKKVIDRLEDSALYWRNLVKGSSLLANYGGPDNLLETVPTYEQRVPSLNAANVWMMRTVAKLRARSGEVGTAANLTKQADDLAKQVLDLYVDGKGYWACLLDSGQRIEVRHCIDFFFIVACMREDLGRRRLNEMADFVNRELWTKDWLRALSEMDGAAEVSLRPDHGSTGSFDAWPAFTAEAMFRAGHKGQALARLRSIDQVTREGPFGQAHLVAEDQHPTRKAVVMDYCEDGSAAFAEVIIRTLFGFAPGIDEGWTWSAPNCPGLEAELMHVRFNGELLDHKSGA